MQLVVDPGAFTKSHTAEAIAKHLAAAPTHKVILTDFALEEALKNSNVVGFKRTFAAISARPSQLEVLRQTGAICRLAVNQDNVRASLIDEVATNRFRVLCHNVFTGAHGSEATLTRMAQAAENHFASLLSAAEPVRQDILTSIRKMPPDSLRLLREENRIGAELAGQITRSVAHDVALLFRHVGITEVPDPDGVVYSFPLRFVLANLVLAIFWGMKGGAKSATSKTIRNDVTDTTYVAYATLYDGLITADDKMQGVYQNTRALLPKLFHAEVA